MALTIEEMQQRAHANSREKGWYDNDDGKRNVGEMLALIHSEVSEALEDWRDGNMKSTHREDGKPVGFGSELADIVIRVGDLAEFLGIDLESEIFDKMSYNRTRPHRHGGKVA